MQIDDLQSVVILEFRTVTITTLCIALLVIRLKLVTISSISVGIKYL